MRKRTLEAPPDAGAIQTYTSDLSRRLRHAVPGERADEIVREAEAHLHDQADAIANASEASVPRQEAETRAVATFTPPVAFARDMARSAVETRYSKAWHKTGKVLAVLLLCVFGALFLTDGVFFIPMSPFWIFRYGLIYLLLGPTMGVCLCAFLSRRAQTRRLLCSVALLALLLFVHDGFFSVMSPPVDGFAASPMSRLRFQEIRALHPYESVQVDNDIHLLNAGLKTYGQKNPTVPGLLRGINGRGYLVPYAVTANMVLAKADPKNFQHDQYDQPFSIAVQGPSQTVETVTQARARWLKYGPFYVAQARAEKERAARSEAAMGKALQQTGFSTRAGWWLAAETLRSGLFLVILDWLFAKMGRAVYVKLRARRERKASHA